VNARRDADIGPVMARRSATDVGITTRAINCGSQLSQAARLRVTHEPLGVRKADMGASNKRDDGGIVEGPW
jgi:hypothetical protein